MSLGTIAALGGTLRSKFLLSLTLITALITSAVLLVVQYRVRIHVREEIAHELSESVAAFRGVQEQREAALQRSTALLATLPPLKAVMTSGDPATIQDASATFWKLAGSQLFVLTDQAGTPAAFHTDSAGFTQEAARISVGQFLADREPRAWWFGGGHLFEVFLEPIYFGSPESGHPIGILAVGYEVDPRVAADATRVAASVVGFGYEKHLVVSTVASAQRDALARYVAQSADRDGEPVELRLGQERFVATSVRLSTANAPLVTLTLLKSFDQATAFLQSLDRWIVAIGVVGVLAGAVLIFFVSTTITKPLGRLVAGVQALEAGDFAYPLELRGRDEVSTLTAAFERMRRTLQETQRRLLESEQLATIGRLASTISHDLRHPLTAILAYAEFLSESDLSEVQRKDFFQEIRIAVNRMMDEINSLLGFSKESEVLRLAYGPVDTVIDRAIRMVKALPEFECISIELTEGDRSVGWFDPAKLERAMLNLLFNAAEAVPPASGRIEVRYRVTDVGTEIRVADNGPGIPDAITKTLFQPFVSLGKERGIGLGLTVVHNIAQQHGGDVCVERTGSSGTVFRLFLPAAESAAVPDRAD